jgi:hypothetical protein
MYHIRKIPKADWPLMITSSPTEDDKHPATESELLNRYAFVMIGQDDSFVYVDCNELNDTRADMLPGIRISTGLFDRRYGNLSDDVLSVVDPYRWLGE